jgi:cell division protein FtsN
MKPRRNSGAASKKRSGGGTLLGLFIGLVLGVLAAAGVVWYIFKTPTPFTNKGQNSPLSASPAAVAPPANAAAVPAGAVPAPLPLPGKPGDPIPQNGDKPRFDFYKILPGNADAIPDPKPAESKPADTAKEKAESVLKEAIYLQTGSFQSASDADSQKAKLAMMGVEASVQQVMLQDKVWFRVRVGPFKKMDEVTGMRSDLAKQGIETNVVKKD